jgi:hypothetical protein
MEKEITDGNDYRYDLGIMGIMSVVGGCLTRKRTQECLAVLP